VCSPLTQGLVPSPLSPGRRDRCSSLPSLNEVERPAFEPSKELKTRAYSVYLIDQIPYFIGSYASSACVVSGPAAGIDSTVVSPGAIWPSKALTATARRPRRPTAADPVTERKPPTRRATSRNRPRHRSVEVGASAGCGIGCTAPIACRRRRGCEAGGQGESLIRYYPSRSSSQSIASCPSVVEQIPNVS
jgi:hypothetical protein